MADCPHLHTRMTDDAVPFLCCVDCGTVDPTSELRDPLCSLMEEKCDVASCQEVCKVPEPEASGVAHLAEVRRKPRESVIMALEMALERARSGEAIGVVVLLNQGDSTSDIAAGAYRMTDMLMAFEDWKFKEMITRNLICPECGHDERAR